MKVCIIPVVFTGEKMAWLDFPSGFFRKGEERCTKQFHPPPAFPVLSQSSENRIHAIPLVWISSLL